MDRETIQKISTKCPQQTENMTRSKIFLKGPTVYQESQNFSGYKGWEKYLWKGIKPSPQDEYEDNLQGKAELVKRTRVRPGTADKAFEENHNRGTKSESGPWVSRAPGGLVWLVRGSRKEGATKVRHEQLLSPWTLDFILSARRAIKTVLSREVT